MNNSHEEFKLSLSDYCLLYIKRNMKDKLEWKIPMKKKVNVEIKNFSINTRSFFDTKWKKMKKIMHYLEKVGERYFEIGKFPIKIFL